MSKTDNTADLNQKIKDVYNDLPYESGCFPYSSPESISAIAIAYGLNPVDVATARVLELGSASGGNIIPFAIKFPESDVVGVDLSEEQIKEGCEIVEKIGINNLVLEAKDILTIDESFGEFDYIICHGVYSWVPEVVREAILRICQVNLSERGIAYISYNTYPGWKSKEVIRDAMLLGAQGSDDQVAALAKARDMYNFLDKFAPQNGLLRNIIQQNQVVADGTQDHYLVHEYLEPVNEPCYLREFLNAIERYDLAYFSDAQPQATVLSNYDAAIAQPIIQKCQGDFEAEEQYLDFLLNKKFRKSLITRISQKQHFTRTLSIDNFKKLYLSCHLHTPKKLMPDDTLQAVGDESLNFKVSNVSYKALVKYLNRCHPSTVSIETLIGIAQNPYQAFGAKYKHLSANISNEQAEKVVLGFVTVIFNRGLGYFSSQETQVATIKNKKTDKPFISNKRRKWAHAVEIAQGRQRYSNLFHNSINLDKVGHLFISMCDGEHSYQDMFKKMLVGVQEGSIEFSQDGKKITDFKSNKKMLDIYLTHVWQNMSQYSVLEVQE